jgi:hypothetical protein
MEKSPEALVELSKTVFKIREAMTCYMWKCPGFTNNTLVSKNAQRRNECDKTAKIPEIVQFETTTFTFQVDIKYSINTR